MYGQIWEGHPKQEMSHGILETAWSIQETMRQQVVLIIKRQAEERRKERGATGLLALQHNNVDDF